MAGEAVSWRRGCKVRHRREHQVHPPRSHPQADPQVIITKSCRTELIFTSVSVKIQLLLRDLDVFFFLFTPLSLASFKPIPRWPWIPSCIWRSTYHPLREPRWCVFCPPWRRRPPPNGSHAFSELQSRSGPQPREPGWAIPASYCSQNWGWGEPTWRLSAAAWLLMKPWQWFSPLNSQEFRRLTSFITFCRSCLTCMQVFR